VHALRELGFTDDDPVMRATALADLETAGVDASFWSGAPEVTIRVGAYPEQHPDAADSQADVQWLKRKIDAGATSAITQFFFEADTFLRFRDACAAQGITAPIIPGILPIISWDGAKRFAARCGTRVPGRLNEAFETAARDGREELLALTHCTALCSRLIDEGVEALHFYTLNMAGLTSTIWHRLGL
jgi:methylenetetrahydrofolate reductase (NADPH)